MRLATLLAHRNAIFAQFVRTRGLMHRTDLRGILPLTYEQLLCLDEMQRMVVLLRDTWDLQIELFPVTKYSDTNPPLPLIPTQLCLERDRTEWFPVEWEI